MSRRSPSVIVIGAGMSGICMAIKLKQAGVTDVTVLEKADEIGGTWRDNTYPGLTCDVPSSFYQYSFAMNPDWSQMFSGRREIHDYFERTTDAFEVREHVHCGEAVVAADFVDERWRVNTTAGTVREADFLISATGVLHHPQVPDVAGLETFEGAAFHSSRWDHSVPLRGRRVAVVGSGSTGVQIVSELGGEASQVLMFQRTAQWILPLPNRRVGRTTRLLLRNLPVLPAMQYRANKRIFELFASAVTRPGWQRRMIGGLCRLHLRAVRDPDLRRKLTPPDQPMCKRLVMSSKFYRVVQRPDVDVVTEGIDHVEPGGIVTTDGAFHAVDVIAFATGFDAHAYLRPIELTGPDGRTLSEAWRDGPRAYRTVALPGFPNFFMLMGPHSPIGNFSLVSVAEAQVDYVLRWIESWRAGTFTTAAPSQEATDRFNLDLREAMPETVWVTGCSSWYLGQDGLPEVWPWTPQEHEAMLQEVDRSHFEVDPVRT